MTFDWTISIGNVITMFGFVLTLMVGGWRLSARVAVFERVLLEHAATLVKHAKKMDDQDAQFVKLLREVSELVGRLGRRGRSVEP